MLGAALHIQVSNGKLEAVIVPRVVGFKQEEAATVIENAGLIAKVKYVDVTDKHEEGIVLSQVPIGDKPVDPGSTVTITVGQKAAPPPPGT